MSGITVVAVLVRCTQGLLLCEDVGRADTSFADIEACTRRLPAIIEDIRRDSGLGLVVMGRCRFLLEDGGRQPASSTRVPSG
jgi:hypothetical protein